MPAAMGLSFLAAGAAAEVGADYLTCFPAARGERHSVVRQAAEVSLWYGLIAPDIARPYVARLGGRVRHWFLVFMVRGAR